MIPELQAQLDQLKEALVNLFSIEELQNVAWQMEMNWDDLPGDTITTKAISIVRLAQRQNLVSTLKSIINKLRDNANV